MDENLDRVIVKISVHDGRKTIQLYMECEGEDEFVVGEKYISTGSSSNSSTSKCATAP